MEKRSFRVELVILGELLQALKRPTLFEGVDFWGGAMIGRAFIQ